MISWNYSGSGYRCIRDNVIPLKAIYTWYTSGIYCQLADYKLLPTTFCKNLDDRSFSWRKKQHVRTCHQGFPQQQLEQKKFKIFQGQNLRPPTQMLNVWPIYLLLGSFGWQNVGKYTIHWASGKEFGYFRDGFILLKLLCKRSRGMWIPNIQYTEVCGHCSHCHWRSLKSPERYGIYIINPCV